MTSPHRPHDRASDERGVALILVLFLMFMAGGLIMLSTQSFLASQRDQTTSFHSEGHAYQFARSGLIEAANWFRSQPSQPVATFAPKRDVLADPKILETDDPDIGLMRQFQVSGNIWGRYEIFKPWASDPDPDRALLRSELQAEDLSLQLGQVRAGLVWRLRSRGMVFLRIQGDKAPDEHPNRVLAVETVQTEIRRTLSINDPGGAAVSIHRADSVSLGGKVRVFGGKGHSAIAYPSSTGSISSTATLTGTPPKATRPGLDVSFPSVFGVTFEEMKLQADFLVSDVTALPDPLPEGSIVAIDNTGIVDIGPSTPLNGKAVVVTNGSLRIKQGSQMNLAGVLYVANDLTIEDGPCWFRGIAVIGTGSFNATGAMDFATFNYDDKVLEDLRKRHNYRISGAIGRY